MDCRGSGRKTLGLLGGRGAEQTQNRMAKPPQTSVRNVSFWTEILNPDLPDMNQEC